jgi:hypothetical protein
MQTSSPTARDRRAVRRTLLVFGATAAIAVGVFVLATAVARDTGSGSPTVTVRDFLLNAVAEHDGFGACRYLTRRALLEVDAVEPPHTSCEGALSSATLVLGKDRVDDESGVKRLPYRAERRGDRVRVTVSAGGAARTFVLRKGSRRELQEFQAPPTSWRIDAGVDALVRR